MREPPVGSSGRPACVAAVIGGSAGALDALQAVLTRLPADLLLRLLVAQHLHASDGGRFARHLDAISPLPVLEAEDKQDTRPGHVYVAPCGYHLLVERDGTLSLSVDEKVNWARPSIDVLFETAARAWGRRLVGVLLSGANHDGAAGMQTIARFGGVTLVQDPATAPHPVMPQAALAATPVDQVLAPQDLAPAIVALSAAQEVNARTSPAQGTGGAP